MCLAIHVSMRLACAHPAVEMGKVAVRMNLRCRLEDLEDGVWLTTLHDAAQQVMGMTADELHATERGCDGEG